MAMVAHIHLHPAARTGGNGISRGAIPKTSMALAVVLKSGKISWAVRRAKRLTTKTHSILKNHLIQHGFWTWH
jgi:hypothetical protein